MPNTPTLAIPSLRLSQHPMLSGSHGLPAHVKPCYRTAKSTQSCILCGVKERRMHMPVGRVGHFCTRCCPACVGEG
jgi:hypothetical protein